MSPGDDYVLARANSGDESRIYAWQFPDGAPREVAKGNVKFPVWSPDGRWIYYVRDGGIVGLPVDISSGFRIVGEERVIYEDPNLDDSRLDLFSNGDILASVRDRGNRVVEHVQIFQNWGDHLRRLAKESN